jgi:hypothetical protein
METSFRSEFIGAHVTPEVKEALIKKARREGSSVSRLTYRLLKKELRVKDGEDR